MRITSITPMKNEGPYILEWVAYNRMIGLNDMLVFTNDCTDGTDLILERLDEMGILRHMPNPSVTHENPRHHIVLIQYVNKMRRLRRSDWIIHLDADEYIRVKVGKGHLHDLFAAIPDAHAISLGFHSFGTNGQDAIAEPDRLMIERHTQRNDNDLRKIVETKYFARGDFPWRKFRNNSLGISQPTLDQVRWVDGNGNPMRRDLMMEPFRSLPKEDAGFDLVDVAHFAVRSFRGYLVMKNRGSANPVLGVRPEDLEVRKARNYFRKFNQNQIEDRLLVDRAADLRDSLAELMADPELARLHEASTAWHAARAEQLITKDRRYKNLYNLIRRDHAEYFGDNEDEDGGPARASA